MALSLVGEDEKVISDAGNNLKNEGQQLSRNVLYRVLLVGILAMGLAVIIVIISSARLSKPIQRSVEIATSIAEGNLHQEVDVSGSFEMAQLGEALRKMSENLEKHDREVAESHKAIALKVRVQKEILDMIGESSETVAMNSREFSESTRFLAEKLTEQSKALEEINNRIGEY